MSGKGRVNGMIVVCMCVLLAVQSDFAKQLLRGMEQERERCVWGEHKGHLKRARCNEGERAQRMHKDILL